MIKVSNTFSLKNIDNKIEWNELLERFDDANIYQTWSYAEIVQSEKVIEHIAIFEDEKLFALALVRIKSIPLIKIGVAYIYRGPLWSLKGYDKDIKDFYKSLEVLRSHYTINQNFVLKVRPSLFTDKFESLEINNSLYFDPGIDNKKYRTLILYLNQDLIEIRKNFKQKWRNCLNQAERNGLEVVEGSSRELYDIFIELYDQMIKRKKFKEYVDIRKKGIMNDLLADKFKLKIYIAYKDKIPISALVGSVMGDTGIYLLGATNELGMKLKSAYLLQWEMIKWLKSKDIKRYDLGGIDPKANPGVYKFKVGISEKEVFDFGSLETSDNKFIKKMYDLIHFIKIKLMVLTQYLVSFEENGIRLENF